MASDTIFKKIINKEVPAEIVYEDEEIIAFKDISPKAPIHILIIPKENISTLNDTDATDDRLLGRLLLTAKKIAAKMEFAHKGYRVVINCNKDGGQEIYHLHLHLLAGRQLQWPPG